MEQNEIDAAYEFTEAGGGAMALASSALEKGYTHIVSVGGDGTSHEIANVLKNTDAVLGIVPSGSGNDFPKAAGIPQDVDTALDNILSGSPRKVDVGTLGDRCFINGLGIGLDGAVSHRFKNLKKFGGELGYLWGAVQEALKFNGFRVGVEIGDWEYEGVLLLAGASNGIYQGGKFKLAPDASVDDGILDFHIISDMSSLNRLLKIPKVMKGTHADIEEVELKKATKMLLTLHSDVPAHMDGEPFYLAPGTHEVSILPRSLTILSN